MGLSIDRAAKFQGPLLAKKTGFFAYRFGLRDPIHAPEQLTSTRAGGSLNPVRCVHLFVPETYYERKYFPQNVH